MSKEAEQAGEGSKEKADAAVGMPNKATDDFPVVGLGASAGGLDAFKRFFKNMPADAGIAFVLIQHLDPNHESLLPELLGKITKMTVLQAQESMALAPNHIYIIPPNTSMTLLDGHLRLTPPRERRGLRMPIDIFFRSLAWDKQEQAIAAVLSGTGSDGTLGLKAVKELGGLTLAQEPRDAQHSGMPCSALNTSMVDFMLPVEQMPERLLNFIRYTYAFRARPSRLPQDQVEVELKSILQLIKKRKQHDFSAYKRGTLTRRIERRMGLNHIETLADYRKKLEQDSDELGELTRDLLIGVTAFFRDGMAYETLEKEVVQKICEQLEGNEDIRCWVPGCATGEEAYSLAMLIHEALQRHKKENCRVRIFATDIDREALEFARNGLYPESVVADVSPERLSRFFTRINDEYHVKKFVRESITFSLQNVLSDPPFSRLSLISCRNLLIYLNQEAQHDLFAIFHFALSPDGYLFLGTAESANQSELFYPVSKKWRIYSRAFGHAGRRRMPRVHHTPALRPHITEHRTQPGVSYRQIAVQALLDHHAPAAVMINEQYETLQVLGRAGDYLNVPAGDPSNNLLEMVTPRVRNKLRAAVHKCRQQEDQAYKTTLLPDEDALRGNRLELIVKGITVQELNLQLYLIVFQEREPVNSSDSVPADNQGDADAIIRQLENELKTTRDDLESTIEQLETANEELKASNEEMMSMNEEFQSINEELETSKEELQSLNEELSTVNVQLQEKVQEVEQGTNDLTNLLNSTHIATIFLDTHFNIRRFTPAAADVLRLRNADIGRPFEHIRTSFDDPDLIDDARNVLHTLAASEAEVHSDHGATCIRRITPYRTEDNRIEGVVITYVDITRHKQAEEALSESEARHRAIGENVPFGSWTCDAEGRCTYVTRPFMEMVGMELESIVNFGWLSRVPEADRDQLFHDWMRCVKTGCDWDYEYRIEAADGKMYDLMTKGRPIRDEAGNIKFWAGFHLDITERKRMERELRELNETLEQRVQERSREAVDRADQVRRLAGQLSHVEQRERQRLADVLHNHFQQLLVAIRWRLSQFKPGSNREITSEQYDEIHQLIGQAIDETRTLSHTLSPLVLQHGGFPQGLQWLADNMRQKHGLDVALTMPENLEPVCSEMAHLLFESIRELLFNVVKHAGVERAWITVEQPEPNRMRIEVGDHGKGCNPDLLDKTLTQDTKSYGLMSINERLQLFDGNLSFTSEVGNGFCALIETPNRLNPDDADEPARDATPDPVRSVHLDGDINQEGVNGDRIRILIADDHRIVREGLISLLEEDPALTVVGEAGDGKEAVELAHQLRPDVVLMDVNMPRLNGIEATRAIRNQIPGIGIIGLSVNEDGMTARQMREAGAQAYATKDLPLADLGRMIRDVSSRTL